MFFVFSKQRGEDSKYYMVFGNKVEVNFKGQEILMLMNFMCGCFTGIDIGKKVGHRRRGAESRKMAM